MCNEISRLSDIIQAASTIDGPTGEVEFGRFNCDGLYEPPESLPNIPSLQDKVQRLLQKLAESNFWLDCHTKGERGSNHCGFEGTHICVECQNADLRAEVFRLRNQQEK